MSRHVQVTFDARDPRSLSSFWRDVLGYVHPGPPGVGLPEGADPLAAWDEFLEQAGVPEDQRNTASAVEDPEGRGPRLFFQQVPEDKIAKIRVHGDRTFADKRHYVTSPTQRLPRPGRARGGCRGRAPGAWW